MTKRGSYGGVLLVAVAVVAAFFFLTLDFNVVYLKSGITALTFVEGDESNATTSGVSSFAVEVGGLPINNSLNYSGDLTVEFFDGSNVLASFVFDFDTDTLNMDDVSVEKTAGGIAVNGVSANKTLYVGKENTNSVCVKNVDGASIASITGSCTGASETLVECDGTVQSGFICGSYNATTFSVSGLTSSALSSYELSITSVALSLLGQGAYTTLNITGTGFETNATVTFGDPDVTVLNSSVSNSTLMNVTIYVALDTAVGVVPLVITNPDGNFTSYNITIVEGPLNMSSMNVTYSSNVTGASSFYNISIETSPGVVKSTLSFNSSYLEIGNSTFLAGNISLPNATDPPDVFYFTGYGVIGTSGYWDDNEFYTTVTQSAPCSIDCEKEQEGYYYYAIYSGAPVCDFSPDCVGGTFTVGSFITETLTLVGPGCTPPITSCSVVLGALPPTLGVVTFPPLSCIVSGTATTPGIFSATISGIDSSLPIPNEGLTVCDYTIVPAPTGVTSSGGGVPGIKTKDPKICVSRIGTGDCYACFDIVPGLEIVSGDIIGDALYFGTITDASGEKERQSSSPFVAKVGSTKQAGITVTTWNTGGEATAVIPNFREQFKDSWLGIPRTLWHLPWTNYYVPSVPASEVNIPGLTTTGVSSIPVEFPRGTTYGEDYIENPTITVHSDSRPLTATINGVEIPIEWAGPDCPTPEFPIPPPGPECTEGAEGGQVTYHDPFFGDITITDADVEGGGVSIATVSSVHNIFSGAQAFSTGGSSFRIPDSSSTAYLAPGKSVPVDEWPGGYPGFPTPEPEDGECTLSCSSDGVTATFIASPADKCPQPTVFTIPCKGLTTPTGPYGTSIVSMLPGCCLGIGGGFGTGGGFVMPTPIPGGGCGPTYPTPTEEPGDPGKPKPTPVPGQPTPTPPPPINCQCGPKINCISPGGSYSLLYVCKPKPPCKDFSVGPFPCATAPGNIPNPPGQLPGSGMPFGGTAPDVAKDHAACCARKCTYETKTWCEAGILYKQEVQAQSISGGAPRNCPDKPKEIIGTCDYCTEELKKRSCAVVQLKAGALFISKEDKKFLEECCTKDLPCKNGEERECVPEGVARKTTTLTAMADSSSYSGKKTGTTSTFDTQYSSKPKDTPTGGFITGFAIGSGSVYTTQPSTGNPIFTYAPTSTTQSGIGSTTTTSGTIGVSSGSTLGNPVVVSSNPPKTNSVPPLSSLSPTTKSTDVVDFVPEGCLGKEKCVDGKWTSCQMEETAETCSEIPQPKCGDGNLDKGEDCDGGSCMSFGTPGHCTSDCKCKPGPAPPLPTPSPQPVPPTLTPVPPPQPTLVPPTWTPVPSPQPTPGPGGPGPTILIIHKRSTRTTQTTTVAKSPSIQSPKALGPLSVPDTPVKDTCIYSETNMKLERISEAPAGTLPSGKQMAFGLRSLNTGAGAFDITASVSEVFSKSDTQVLKCSKENGKYVCAELDKGTSGSPSCGGLSISKLQYAAMNDRADMVSAEELQGFSSVTKKLSSSDKIVNKDKFTLFVDVSRDTTFTIGPPTDALQQPPNPYTSILSAMVVTLPAGEEKLPARITMPLPKPLPPNIDKFTIRMYVWDGSRWAFINKVMLDTPTSLIMAELDDLRTYAIDGKVYVAVIGSTCIACTESRFDMVYDGGGEKVVVLVPGLSVQGVGTWAPLVKEIEMAQLPLQVYAFSYPSWYTTDRASQDLADFMQSQSHKYKIFPVGHSAGGLIVEQALFDSNFAREEDPSAYSYLDKVKNGAVILLGVPNKGSPVADIWVNLFSHISELDIPLRQFNLNSPILKDVINGKSIPPVPYLKYFVLAGTRPLEFNLGFFTVDTSDAFRMFQPNDGVISTDSAYTVGHEEFNNLCDNYFEAHLTHIELNDHEIARRIIERIINEQFRNAAPITEPMPGYDSYVNFRGQGWKKDDVFIVVSKQLPTDAMAGVMPMCTCGNGVCGEGETIWNCPSDCFVRQVNFFCARAPGWVLMLLVLAAIAFGVHAFRRKEHNKSTHTILYSILGVIIILLLLIYLVCKEFSLLAWVMTLVLLALVFAEGRRKPKLQPLPPLNEFIMPKRIRSKRRR